MWLYPFGSDRQSCRKSGECNKRSSTMQSSRLIHIIFRVYPLELFVCIVLPLFHCPDFSTTLKVVPKGINQNKYSIGNWIKSSNYCRNVFIVFRHERRLLVISTTLKFISWRRKTKDTARGGERAVDNPVRTKR